MPHADSAWLPKEIVTKVAFWEHVHGQLQSLVIGQRSWVTNLANASSLLYNALLAFNPHFGHDEKMVNWCGFYVDSPLLPAPTLVRANATSSPPAETLLLGPFCGKPACQLIRYKSGKSRGVCADAYIQRRTLLVADVEAYPGHIACDGETKSEVVVPLLVRPDGSAAEFGDKTAHAVGVLDLDCLALGGFDEQDKVGLEKIAQLIVASCDW